MAAAIGIRAGSGMTKWRLLQGEVLVGELSEYDCDQPFFLARFTPGPGWESVRALLEAWAAFKGSDPDGARFVALAKPLQDLELTLAPVDGRQPPLQLFKNCMVRIKGPEARLRY
ncbi:MULTISPECIES: hypothetical protein [Streptomyces]|uniref:Uncharacterized protein n=1 Tax=Streptomyces nymphaeiformis TaxID=2663842 RepID=A0A7W7U876_9ACTN|nr:hypothetical protein [Streptomyces nymphaeiformis]MBB4986744.1 hypothetical protein [Streptomyces nymphaeiformis]